MYFQWHIPVAAFANDFRVLKRQNKISFIFSGKTAGGIQEIQFAADLPAGF